MILYGIAQGVFFWILYAQLSQAHAIEKALNNRAVYSPLVLLALCVVFDLTILRKHDMGIDYEAWPKSRVIGVPLLAFTVIVTHIYSYMYTKDNRSSPPTY